MTFVSSQTCDLYKYTWVCPNTPDFMESSNCSRQQYRFKWDSRFVLCDVCCSLYTAYSLRYRHAFAQHALHYGQQYTKTDKESGQSELIQCVWPNWRVHPNKLTGECGWKYKVNKIQLPNYIDSTTFPG